MQSFTFTAGRLLCRYVRRFLKEQEFIRDIKWIESDGWIERDFTIKGNPNDVQVVFNSLNAWSKENQLSE